MAKILLKDLEVYKMAHNIGIDVLKHVSCWNFFEKDTLGKQIVKAADSKSLTSAKAMADIFTMIERNFFIIPEVRFMKLGNV